MRRFGIVTGTAFLILFLAGAVAYFGPRLFPGFQEPREVPYMPRFIQVDSCPPPESIMNQATPIRDILCFEAISADGGSQIKFFWPEGVRSASFEKGLEPAARIRFGNAPVDLTLLPEDRVTITPEGYKPFILGYPAQAGFYYTLIYR